MSMIHVKNFLGKELYLETDYIVGIEPLVDRNNSFVSNGDHTLIHMSGMGDVAAQGNVHLLFEEIKEARKFY